MLNFLIECKKSNPELVNWIFFPKFPYPNSPSLYMTEVRNRRDNNGRWAAHMLVRTLSTPLTTMDEAWETKANFKKANDKGRTKTSNADVSEAAYQVTLATQAISQEVIERVMASDRDVNLPWSRQVFLPVIVTSAHLFVCNFDVKKVSAATGEISFEHAKLSPAAGVLTSIPFPAICNQALRTYRMC